ncbi:MAG: aminoacyl-tRNA deacylase [Anaerolineae bacterium]
MTAKTNSMRLLDQRRIAYRVHTFPEAIHSAAGVAEHLGLSPAMVYKTLVVLPDRGRPMLVIIAGDRELNLKKVAGAVGVKKVKMASQTEAERLTGLQVGGISALALLHKPFKVYLDQRATGLERLLVSAGKRGINLELAVSDLRRVSQARLIEAT